jgi:2-methylisocitrate lyase-like PEP mutase family enzyme
MILAQQRDKAVAFRNLHRGPGILVLPNAWDAVSARLFEQAGFPAVATTSGGIATLFGFPDGQNIPRRLMLEVLGHIAALVSVPVSADLERGYGDTPEEIGETILTAIRLGVVGANLEDGTGEPAKPVKEVERQVEIIKAVRKAAEVAEVPFFLNARIDLYLREVESEDERFQETVRRAHAYREAGADCIFPIGVKDRELIRRLAREIPAPINILALPDSPTISELQDWGVARVTFGSGLMRATMPLVREMAKELREIGSCAPLAKNEFPTTAVKELFSSSAAQVRPVDMRIILDAASRKDKSPSSASFTEENLLNFTPRAQQALALAKREADKLNHNFVGTEHLLLGIIALGQGVATNVLLTQGLDLSKMRQEILSNVSRGPDQQIIGNVPYTPRLKKVLALAAREAKALDHTYVGTEHLLLGLLGEGDGLAGRMLRGFGVDLNRTRRDIVKELDPNA